VTERRAQLAMAGGRWGVRCRASTTWLGKISQGGSVVSRKENEKETNSEESPGGRAARGTARTAAGRWSCFGLWGPHCADEDSCTSSEVLWAACSQSVLQLWFFCSSDI